MPKNPTSAATPITYADAGVDIDVANRTKKRIKYLAHKTFTRGVLSEIGGFGGLFAVDKAKYLDPVLVSSVDGVGTKLKIAFEMGLHSTVGADLVNHCVNDIAVQGAAPLFFMDYLATGKLEPSIAEQIVEGIADACKHNGCALIGGETAEMPGFYPKGEYDLAGFIVGVVERDRIITGKEVQIGDVVLGMASNGLHTNGYSLARKLLFEVAQYSTEDYVNEIKNKVGNELMRTHKSYWPALRKLIERSARRNAAYVQYGIGDAAGGSAGEIQEGPDRARARRREGFHCGAHRQGRAQGDLQLSADSPRRHGDTEKTLLGSAEVVLIELL